MFDPTYRKVEVKRLGGAWTYIDSPDVPLTKALQAQNCVFLDGQVSTRTGFGTAYAANEAMTGMHNWISSLGNNLVWFKVGTGIRLTPVSSPSISTVSSIASGYSAVFADAGARLYAAVFDADGYSTTQGRVIAKRSGSFTSDTLFSPPITYTPSAPAEPGAGVITVGVHRVGYIIETRSGFIGRPSPSTTGTPGITTFSPVSFTAAGSKNARLTLNTTWPTDAVKVHVIMTTVSNENKYYFVPGANTAVNGGQSQSVDITFSISDDDLVAQADEATDHLFLSTQATDATGPFNPSVVFSYGDRMVYVTRLNDNNSNKTSYAIISNRNAFQEVTLDKHIVQLPGQLDFLTGFSLQGTLYLLGPHWTYSTHDTGDDPVTWPSPNLIDGRRGTLSPRGVEVSPVGNYAWVCDKAGLYLFSGGKYPSLPVSYHQTDQWNRINWGAAETVEVKDDPEHNMVYVKAPLDSETTPTSLLVWDYTKGTSPEKVEFSIWPIGGVTGVGAIAFVQNDWSGTPTATQKHMELCVGTNAAEPILRRLSSVDTNPYRDNGAAINWIYKTALLPGVKPVQVNMQHGMHVRAKGVGQLQIQALTMDEAWSQVIEPITLGTAPGKEYSRHFYQFNEGVVYKFSMATIDSYATLSGITHYHSPYLLE